MRLTFAARLTNGPASVHLLKCSDLEPFDRKRRRVSLPKTSGVSRFAPYPEPPKPVFRLSLVSLSP